MREKFIRTLASDRMQVYE